MASESEKVHITEAAEADLARMSPSDIGWFAGAIILLENDEILDQMKIDLSDEDDYGEPIFALSTPRLFIAYVERDGRIDVIHVARQSRFRPPLMPF